MSIVIRWYSRRTWCVVLMVIHSLLGGCATRSSQPSSPDRSLMAAQWIGRLSIRIEEQPVQLWVVHFDLQGNINQGELTLNGPLGQTLAQAHWHPQYAQLNRSDGTTQHFHNLDELWRSLTQIDFDPQVLFAWLEHGQFTPPIGWQTDVKTSATRLHLTRVGSTTIPTVRLDVVLQ